MITRSHLSPHSFERKTYTLCPCFFCVFVVVIAARIVEVLLRLGCRLFTPCVLSTRFVGSLNDAFGTIHFDTQPWSIEARNPAARVSSGASSRSANLAAFGMPDGWHEARL